jgi:hypothetical protein
MPWGADEDDPVVAPAAGRVPGGEDRAVALVVRGLLHDLANVATALDGVLQLLATHAAADRADGAADVVPRARADLSRVTDRLFTLHAHLRSLTEDPGAAQALDPRVIAAEVAALLAWHIARPCTVEVAPGDAAPILGESWRVRRALLEACDAEAGPSGALRFAFQVEGDEVRAVREDGRPFWSAPQRASAGSDAG